MTVPNDNSRSNHKQLPERKWGPFPGGVALVMWLKQVKNRSFRSLTIQHRRFLDPMTGAWRDGALRPADLPALILALQDAQRFMAEHPVPGLSAEEDEQAVDDGELPNSDSPDAGAPAATNRSEDIPF